MTEFKIVGSLEMKPKRLFPAESTLIRELTSDAFLSSRSQLSADDYLQPSCARLSDMRSTLQCLYDTIPRPYTFSLAYAPDFISKKNPLVVVPHAFLDNKDVGMCILDESMLNLPAKFTPKRTKSADFHIPPWAEESFVTGRVLAPKEYLAPLVQIRAVLYDKKTKHVFFTIVAKFTTKSRLFYISEVINTRPTTYRGFCSRFFDQLINYMYYHPKLSCNEVRLECLISDANQGKTLYCYMQVIGSYFPVYLTVSPDPEQMFDQVREALYKGYEAGDPYVFLKETSDGTSVVPGTIVLGLAMKTKDKTLQQLLQNLERTFSTTQFQLIPEEDMYYYPMISWFRVYDGGRMYVMSSKKGESWQKILRKVITKAPQTKPKSPIPKTPRVKPKSKTPRRRQSPRRSARLNKVSPRRRSPQHNKASPRRSPRLNKGSPRRRRS
jgi:hypothetical protein